MTVNVESSGRLAVIAGVDSPVDHWPDVSGYASESVTGAFAQSGGAGVALIWLFQIETVAPALAVSRWDR